MLYFDKEHVSFESVHTEWDNVTRVQWEIDGVLFNPIMNNWEWEWLHHTATPHSAQQWHSWANNPEYISDSSVNILLSVLFPLLANAASSWNCAEIMQCTIISTWVKRSAGNHHLLTLLEGVHTYHTCTFLRGTTAINYISISHWVKSENSQNPSSEVRGI